MSSSPAPGKIMHATRESNEMVGTTLFRLAAVMAGAFYLWIGLFILTRDPQHLRARLAGAAMIIIAALPFGVVMYQAAESAETRTLWGRLMLAAVPIANALWCHVAITLALETLPLRRPQRWAQLGWMITAIGPLLGAINSLGSRQTGGGFPDLPSYFCLFTTCPTGTRFYPFIYWLLARSISLGTLLLFSATFIQTRRRQDPSRAGISWLTLASLALFLAALALDAYRLGFITLRPYALLIGISIPLIGWGIAKYNALLQSRILEMDFAMAFGIFALTIVAYTLLPWLLVHYLFANNIVSDQTDAFLLALGTGAAVVTHMFIDRVRLRMDALVSDANSVRLRGEFTQLLQDSRKGAPMQITLAQIDLIKTRALIFENIGKQLVRDLDAPDNVPALAHSPLHNLICMRHLLSRQGISPTTASDMQRAGAILTLLEQGLQRLSAADALQRPRHAEQVAILQWRIHGGVDRTEIIRRVNIHPRQYDRLLQESLTSLASAIFELEREAVLQTTERSTNEPRLQSWP